MDERRKVKDQNSKIISASEIAQYYFCSNAWYLQRCGYKPNSPNLEIGTKKHRELGNLIDKTKKDYKKSNIAAVIGIVLLLLSFIIILFEVV